MGRPEIELRGLTCRFGAVTALAEVDLHVEPGELVSVIGPSGCGKSTLLRAIGGLVTPAAGSVEVEGSSPAAARAAKRFGLVPQTPALLPWRTVRQNAALLVHVNASAGGPRVDAGGLDALLHEVGLGHVLDAYPRQLSGGMQQRVALVRAFALGAPILLMDEPFAALDEIVRSEMRYLLLRLWDQHRATVVFVTHSIPEAVILSDRVVVMAARPGRVSAVVPVELPRPRTVEMEDEPRFHALVAEVRRELAAAMAVTA
jgi:NitT/TauT family transport system ATP-binding protein